MDVLEAVRWWDDYQAFRVLPYGSQSLSDEPAFVYDAVALCSRATAQAVAEEQAGDGG